MRKAMAKSPPPKETWSQTGSARQTMVLLEGGIKMCVRLMNYLPTAVQMTISYNDHTSNVTERKSQTPPVLLTPAPSCTVDKNGGNIYGTDKQQIPATLGRHECAG